MQCFFPDKAFPDLSMHCNSFKWKRCSSQAGADQKQGINDSNPMSDVKQFLVNVGNRKGLVCRDASKIADSLMLWCLSENLDGVSSCGFKNTVHCF